MCIIVCCGNFRKCTNSHSSFNTFILNNQLLLKLSKCHREQKVSKQWLWTLNQSLKRPCKMGSPGGTEALRYDTLFRKNAHRESLCQFNQSRRYIFNHTLVWIQRLRSDGVFIVWLAELRYSNGMHWSNGRLSDLFSRLCRWFCHLFAQVRPCSTTKIVHVITARFSCFE